MSYNDFFDGTNYTQEEQKTLLTSFFSEVQTQTKGRVDFGTLPENYSLISVPYFYFDAFAKKYFKSYLNTDKTEFKKMSLELYYSPDKQIVQEYIYPTMLIREFFNGYQFITDENIAELTQPSQRKGIFLSFIAEVKMKSGGKISLPIPVYLNEGLKEDEIYYGFSDSNIAKQLFELYLALTITIKEDERYKVEDFERKYEEMLGAVISNPSIYIRSNYINSSATSKNNEKSYWYKKTARGNNL